VLVTLCLGFFLVMLDTTAVTVALPAIGNGFGATTELLQWVVDSYAVVFAAFLLSAGLLADRLGARRIFLAGMIVFAVGSTVCATAGSGAVLVAGRGVQGAGAALLMPSSLALIRASNPSAQRQSRAIGIWGGIAGIAAASGPLLGGMLVSGFGWRALFLANLPVAVVAVALTLFTVTEAARTPREGGLDILGQGSAFAALACLVTGLIRLGHAHSTSSILVAVGVLAAGSLLTVVVVFVESRCGAPMLDPRLMRHPGFRYTVLTGFALNFGFYGQFFLVTLYLQAERSASPIATGIVLAVQAGGAIAGSPCGGHAAHRYGPRMTMLLGLVLGAAGFVLLAFAMRTPLPCLAAVLFVIGFGIDMAMTAATMLALQVSPPDRSGIATALLNMMRQFGSALGVAALGALAATFGSFGRGFTVAMLVAALSYLAAAALTIKIR
jgi:DHA2 family methylenomycin A resistance protein-like MFS transporter